MEDIEKNVSRSMSWVSSVGAHPVMCGSIVRGWQMQALSDVQRLLLRRLFNRALVSACDVNDTRSTGTALTSKKTSSKRTTLGVRSLEEDESV